MKIKSILRCFLLFIMPSCIIRLWLRLITHKDYKGLKVGFSLILVNDIELSDHCVIGNGNRIHINQLYLKSGSCIGKNNRLFGAFTIILNEKSQISQNNSINCDWTPYQSRLLTLGDRAVIGGGGYHTIDLTRSITIGKHTLFGGVYSQIWTHGFYLSKNGKDSWRVDGEVAIGDNVYIGSNSVICSGVSICSDVSIGAHVCVSKDLTESGMYVSQPVRHIPFDPDVQVGNLTVIQEKPFKIVEKTKK